MNQSPQEYFRFVLVTVVGQAFNAAGYLLDERPAQWAGGQYRFQKPLNDELNGFIEWQHLYYAERPSLYRVTLTRTDKAAPNLPITHALGVQRTLSALVVSDFGVKILPSADHWWTYRDTNELGRTLGEAGSLAIAYGIPWLAGDLKPN